MNDYQSLRCVQWLDNIYLEFQWIKIHFFFFIFFIINLISSLPKTLHEIPNELNICHESLLTFHCYWNQRDTNNNQRKTFTISWCLKCSNSNVVVVVVVIQSIRDKTLIFNNFSFSLYTYSCRTCCLLELHLFVSISFSYQLNLETMKWTFLSFLSKLLNLHIFVDQVSLSI